MTEANDEGTQVLEPVAEEVAEKPRRRGRPKGSGRKAKADVEVEAEATVADTVAEEATPEEKPAPKRRGRRPSRAQEETQSSEGAEPETVSEPEAAVVQRETRVESEREPETARETASEKSGRDSRNEESDANDTQNDTQNDNQSDTQGGRRGRGNRNNRRPSLNYRDLQAKILPELHLLAIEVGLSDYRQLSKEDLSVAILERAAEAEGLRLVKGYLEISSDGYGFLQESLLQNNTRSVIVSAGLIKQFKLRTGDFILGKSRRPRDNERYGTLIRVEAVNGVDPFQAAKRPRFDDLVPTFPEERITLETSQNEVAARVIDLLAPIGRGQRGLIVAPPKAGKTTLLKKIANSVIANEPDIKVIVLLVDERPEEVTDFRESVSGVEVVASTFDEPPTNHIRVAEFVHERSRRIVEEGGHVMILLDSITRLARANNLVTPPTGRTLSGGLDSSALHWPKRFLGAARNIRGGGSLSILATALVETGSRMDDVIFEEFKGTGNMELHLSRRLEERRIFPAIDILKSGTRREDLLLGEEVLAKMWLLRKVISDMDPAEAMDMLLSRLGRTKTNAEFLQSLGGPG
jgi:transcription termination factor Rho